MYMDRFTYSWRLRARNEILVRSTIGMQVLFPTHLELWFVCVDGFDKMYMICRLARFYINIKL